MVALGSCLLPLTRSRNYNAHCSLSLRIPSTTEQGGANDTIVPSFSFLLLYGLEGFREGGAVNFQLQQEQSDSEMYFEAKGAS